MKIQYSDTFSKAFKVLSFAEKEAVLETIRLFQEHPLDPSLHNHPLSKPMVRQRAISAGDDLRIIFREKGDYIEVLMLDVGDHERVY